MEQCWRWYGPNDPVTLDNIKQAGAAGIVTALHNIYDRSAWPLEAILERKRIVEATSLTWSVVESIPVHNSIKIGSPERERYVGWYKDTIRALAKAGISTICYNFMPVVDWTAPTSCTGCPPPVTSCASMRSISPPMTSSC